MYQILIKRHLRNQFDRLNVGDYEAVLRGVDDHVRHRFAGQHPLGGERHSKEALRLWFQRLFRLYRNLDFEASPKRWHRPSKADAVWVNRQLDYPSRASRRASRVSLCR